MAKKASGKIQSGYDLRLEMQVKNNVLWHAIHDQYRSVAALCHAHPALRSQQGIIGDLLRFKISPLKKAIGAGRVVVHTGEYRNVCLTLQSVLGALVEDLFPSHVYEHLLGTETTRVVEVSSFAALPSAVRREVLSLPAPSEQNPEERYARKELRQHIQTALRSLPPRQREVLEYRFGYRDGREWTTAEIAQQIGITASCVRSNSRLGCAKLEKILKQRGLSSFPP